MNDKQAKKLYRQAYQEARRSYSYQKKQADKKSEHPKDNLFTAIKVILIAIAITFLGNQLIGLIVGVTVPLIVLCKYILRVVIVIAILVVIIKVLHK